MKISHKWLQDYVDVDIIGADSEELARTLTMVGLAVELTEEHGKDVIFDIDVTSNRPDCLNHIGVAREIAANYRLNLRKPDFSTPESDPNLDPADFPASVSIESPELCPRYAARIMTDFTIGESPKWLKDRLEAVGQRSINNLVDITNYVLFTTGHPLHAFDYDKLRDNSIIVRTARPGEKLITLDGLARDLDPDMLVICDSEIPVALAGIMGGEETEISPQTRTMLLESAYFEPSSIRRTARQLGMSTEASYRFERGADPRMPVHALNYTCRLIAEICGGKCVGPVIDKFPLPPVTRDLELRSKRINQVLGIDVDLEIAEEILRGLEFSPKKTANQSLMVSVPGFRQDVDLEDDLVEEVARHYGYEQIPSTYPAPTEIGAFAESQIHERILVDSLVSFGFYEAINYVFTIPEREFRFLKSERPMVSLSNPLNEMGTHMRTTLVPGLVDTVRYNLNHGSRNVRLFEVGKGYLVEPADPGRGVSEKLFLCFAALGEFYDPYWTQSREPFGFFHIKGITAFLFEKLGKQTDIVESQEPPFLHPGVSAKVVCEGIEIGHIGELNPELSEEYKLPEKLFIAELWLDPIFSKSLPQPRFKSLPRFPSVQRDLSFLLDRSIEFGKINLLVQNLDLEELADFRLIDLYQGPSLSQEKYSLTVRLTFFSPNRTLTQEEVNECCEKITEALSRSFKIELR